MQKKHAGGLYDGKNDIRKGLDFNAIEKEIYKIGCEYATSMMEQIRSHMDKHLMKNRDKQKYRHKGSHTTTLKTLMGEVPYKRKVYEKRLENGEKAYVYLLDEELKLVFVN